VTTADSASVQACINAAIAGQTVTVTTGTVTWASTVTIAKGITVIVNAGSTVTITNNTSPAFQINNTGAAFVRISGFTINSSDSTQYVIAITGPATSVRIDHMTFNAGDSVICSNCLGSSATGPVYGVVDSSSFTNCGRCYYAQDVRSADPGVAVGQTAWNEFLGHEATFPGSGKFMFFEDNTYTWNRTVSGGQGPLYGSYGGKAVLRHNTFTNWSYYADAHGDQPAGETGTILYEIYNNTFSEGDLYLAQGVMMYLRGGQHLVHDNTFNTTSDFPVSLTVYYSTDLIAHRIKNTFVWNNVWNANGVNQGAATQVQVASDTNGALTLNTNYFLRAPQAGDIYYPYTPYTYPHPLRGTSTTLMPPTGLTASVQ
jgi:hypothetical protein